MIVAGLIFVTSTQADQLIFKNGRVMEGTVLKETPSHVIISIGAGSIKINRSQLKKIVKGSSGKVRKKTKSVDDILHSENAPKELVPLSEKFRKLLAKRREAKNAQYQMGQYQLQIDTCQKQDQQLLKDILYGQSILLSLQEKIAKIKIPETPPTQHDAIEEFNALLLEKEQLKAKQDQVRASILAMAKKRQSGKKKSSECRTFYFKTMDPINVYFVALQKFVAAYSDERKTRLAQSPSKKTQEFFTRMDHYVTQFLKETPTSRIQSKKRNGITLVQAVINGKVSGEFILDTGASNMIISESFAQRLGINVAKLPSREIILANGRRMNVKYGRLESVSLGGSIVRNLDMNVIPNSPNNKESGLLGMSFLKHFAIRLNGATGEIELTHFMPQR